MLLKYMRNISKNKKKSKLHNQERSIDFSYTVGNLSQDNQVQDNLSQDTSLNKTTNVQPDETDKLVYRVTVQGTKNINRILNRLK